MDEQNSVGASVPDQALAVPVEPASSLAPTGFDPSRGACSRACAIRLRLDRRIHAQRVANRETWETVDMRQKGYRRWTLSIIRDVGRLLDALDIPRRSPGGGWWTMLARIDQAIAIAMEARRGETENTGSTLEGGDSAGRKASHKGSSHG